MTNPWLKIPASDYEGHMDSPDVAQLSFLAQAFRESLEKYDSSSIALLGCATGNGLDYINNSVTRRLTAIDINPEYLEVLRQRYLERVPGLEVIKADLEIYTGENRAYSLIFAGLIFEYLRPQVLLQRIAGWLRPGGVMVSILQLPAQNSGKVSETPYKSLRALDSIMNLISSDRFKGMANEAGLRETEAKTFTLESGKPFYIGTYKRSED